MPIHELAGCPAPASVLTDIPRLISAYYTQQPDPEEPTQQVSFGTSGHRGSSFKCTFNEDHVLAITQAICDYRKAQGICGPLYLAKDTHALSEPAHITAIEVLAANGVNTQIQEGNGYTPTPSLSHAIIAYNENRQSALADGIVITPSHNPPRDGGFKYNSTNGGPADADSTSWIARRANELMKNGNSGVKRLPCSLALKADCVHEFDFVTPYVNDLGNVVDLDCIRGSGMKIGADAMGGAGLAYWPRIAETYKLQMDCLHTDADHTFRFMTLDKDGEIRMDCSSPYAMTSLVALKEKYDIAFGNDTDFDRHGIVTPSVGLMNPNHYLATAINYLFTNRDGWSSTAAIGKTLVSSSIIDRVAANLGRRLVEVPVGFKWFVDGLIDGSFGFGGEESAGASFLKKDGRVWSTDKDGMILCLLAAEITARSKCDPGMHYQDLTTKFGSPVYERMDAPATVEQKDKLKKLTPEMVAADTLAGEAITAKLTRAPGNNAELGGLKVTTENGWFAARPSGTEDIYKIYAESFNGPEHLKQLQAEAQSIVDSAIA